MVLRNIVQFANLNVCHAQEFQCVFIHTIGNMINQAGDAGVDQGFGAVEAGEMGDITGAAVGGDPMQGCLDDGVGLSMDGANTMAVNQ